MSLPVIALVGDSTYATIYLRAAGNPALITYWGKTDNYDGRLHIKVSDALTTLGAIASVTNYGVPSWTAAKCLTDAVSAFGGTTQMSAVLASTPDYCIVNFGTNESGISTSKAEYKASMATILDNLIASGITPLIANNMYWKWGPNGGSSTEWINSATLPYCQADAELATAYGLVLVDVRSAFQSSVTAGTWDLWMHNDATYWPTTYSGATNVEAYFSNVHQWESGTQIIADTMAASILTLIGTSPPNSGSAFKYRSANTWQDCLVKVRTNGTWTPYTASLRNNNTWNV